ncbi:hypothetical protein [Streptomyces mirabilis]|uniref:hypothetical protein n=1 Tax=Streptomyces mirabilis TaxID=68239 RepID=UPI0021C17D42|nr:hypothetical protein [Streptomyces mirabilis]MCT9105377.1 hypothetical protein [Streptomyces mirabilis]
MDDTTRAAMQSYCRLTEALRAAIEDPHRSEVEEALTSAAYEANRLMGAAELLGRPQHEITALVHEINQDKYPREPAAEPQPTIWLVTRGEDPGAIPCVDEATARAYAEERYREDEDPDDPAVLRWDEDRELMDDSIPGSYQGMGAGWKIAETPVIRPADLPDAD